MIRLRTTAVIVAGVLSIAALVGCAGTAATTSSLSSDAVPRGSLQVHYIDVGQGDSVLIVAPDGKVMVIDGGESDSGALAYLQARGITHVDLMVATHPHSDHIGGLVDVLGAMPVSEVVTNGRPTTSKTYEHFVEAIVAAGAHYTEARRGDSLSLGSLTFQVLHPDVLTGDDLNSQSLVLRLVYGQVAFLFTGDASETSEASMLAAGEDVQAQILKVGRHGSHDASSPVFLSAVRPEVAVYSCAAGDSSDHPSEKTLANLAEVGATVYGTDVNGTVVVTTDGTTYKVETSKERQPRATPATG
jgi:competence protein ComEC